jgi:hypothetical protein
MSTQRSSSSRNPWVWPVISALGTITVLGIIYAVWSLAFKSGYDAGMNATLTTAQTPPRAQRPARPDRPVRWGQVPSQVRAGETMKFTPIRDDPTVLYVHVTFGKEDAQGSVPKWDSACTINYRHQTRCEFTPNDYGLRPGDRFRVAMNVHWSNEEGDNKNSIDGQRTVEVIP